jgi:SAM-dependent methyltransferase
MSLDIGCGAEPRNPFGAPKLVGVDIRENLGAGVVRADITIEKLPFEANTFDFCTAFDLIEHIPRVVVAGEGSRNPFIELMNEIHRVLKPEGIFLHRTPAFPSRQVFQDPTHVNFITEDTIPYYFCEPDLFAGKMGYGFEGRFELISQSWLWDAWLVGVLRAKK